MAFRVMLCLVLASLLATTSAGRSLTAAPGQLYIKITSSDTTTQVGQQPKIVAQFGNIGGTEVTNLKFICYYYDDQPQNAVVFVSEILQFQKLIPGQNQNAEHGYKAETVGTTHRYCTIEGDTLVNGKTEHVSAKSNTISVTVVPQQG